MKEEWRTVVGYEGLYEISNLGRARALDRRIGCRWGGTRRWRGIVLQPIVASNGYPFVSVCRNGKRKQMSIHRMVLESFVGPRPSGMEACHNDGVRTNCRLDNLRYDTRTNNAADRKTHGTEHVGERAPAARLTDELVRAIRRRDKSAYKWAQELGLGLNTVTRARSGKTWAHIK